MTEETKKDNVVGIGHNQNTYSKEQYAKLVNSLHVAHRFAQQEMARVRRLFDEAFTKYPLSSPRETKLKDFEVHERRADADSIAWKFDQYADAHLESIEKKAKADDIELELDANNLPKKTEEDEESND